MPRTLSVVSGGVYGALWNVMKSVGQPRFMIIQAATGESMPPESSVSTRGLLPTGRPPGALNSSQ